MTRLPRVTGKQVVSALERAGFHVSRTSGSHVRLRSQSGRATTVPVHSGKTLKPKTLATILDQAGLTVEEFNLLL